MLETTFGVELVKLMVVARLHCIYCTRQLICGKI